MSCDTMRRVRAAYYALAPRDRVGVTLSFLLNAE